MFGALESGLRLSQSAASLHLETDADTVFLLSDGAPSTGSLTDPKSILAVIASANAASRIAIHTIGFAPEGSAIDSNDAWMEALAARNFGEHRRIATR